ncbi:MAG: glycosyltransferase family 39 protein [Chloroflexi bacterium]|nr:glycosyltransferase family 39 protein [Chloroflexota bacterium]
MSAAVVTREGEALAILDRAIPAALVAAGLVVRLVEASVLPFPALDDPAFYLKVAENLAQGRGLVIDAIWSYQAPFGQAQDQPFSQVTHPSNEHWMPLASLALAPFFALLGSSFKLAQVVGAMVGSLLVLVAWQTARQALSPRGPWRATASFVAVLVAFNPLLVYQAVTADSSVYFGLLGALALLLAGTRPRRSAGAAAQVGLVGGLAYLARSDGLLLLVALTIWTWLASPEARWRRTGALLLGAAVVVAPWLARNAVTFGSAFPTSGLALALLPDYPTLFHYGGDSFWTGFPPPDAGRLLGLRLEGLGHNLFVLLLQSLFPIAPLALVGFASLRTAPVVALGGAFALALLLAGALLFPVVTIYGAFYHSVGAVLPLITLLAVVGLQRFGRVLGQRLFEDPDFMPILLGIAAFALTLVQFGLATATAAEMHGRWGEQFDLVGQWLREQGARVVMTTQPHSLHYASGLPAVMLPVSDSPEVAFQVAQRYGVDHVVGFGSFGRYPAAFQEEGGAPRQAQDSAPFRLVYEAEGVWIYRVEP